MGWMTAKNSWVSSLSPCWRGATTVFEIPFWVILVCALTIGIGTSFGGWRIIETVGMKMARINSWQGFAAQTSAAFTIFGASHFGTR